MDLWEAALLAVILAPTDAALGQAVVSSDAVPVRMRQSLNVESGLNDGITLPVLLVFLALAGPGGTGEGGEDARTASEWLAYAAKQVTLGPLAGVAVGMAGTAVFRFATGRDWMNESFYKLAGLALALLAFVCAEAIGGNGFIAAFVGGLTFGSTSRGSCRGLYGFLEAEGQLLMLLVFMLLGSALALPALREATPRAFVYALLSLTVVRMLPVALSMIGAGLRPLSTVFLGWFGPRGLASLLFGLLILDEARLTHGEEIFTVVILTVLLSVLLHGLTAVPGAGAYGRAISAERHADAEEHQVVTEHRLRHRPGGLQPE